MPRPSILIVDDNIEVIDALRTPVTRHVPSALFLLHESQSSDALVSEIAARHPSSVFLDANLSGGIRGFDLVSSIRRLDPDIRCVGFSSDDGLAERFLQAGADGFIHKDMGDVQGTVGRVVDFLNRMHE